jgi:AcrR family transcriptional regulator
MNSRGRPRDARCDGAILTATLELLTEAGAAHLSIDAVAARARVGKATIYRRWTSKEALVLEALGTMTDPIPTPDTGSLRGDLDAYFDGLLEKFDTHKGNDVLPHLIEAACYDTEIRASLDHYIATRQEPLRSVLRRAIERGELAPDANVDVMVDLLIGPLIYRRHLTGGPIDRPFVRSLLDFIL